MGLEIDVRFAISVIEECGLYRGIATDPYDARRILREITVDIATPDSVMPVDSVEHLELNGLPARIYRPQSDGDQPILVHYHPGGFVMGDLDSYDALFRRICNEADVIVVAPQLPLAPEHPFPAAPRHALSVMAEVLDDVRRFGRSGVVMVGGESSGANLAAVVAQHFRSQIALQYLVSPFADVAGDYDSRDENAEGYLLTRQLLMQFLGHYLSVAIPDLADPLLSPLYGDLRGLPPALVATAQFDPLRDEGETYAHLMSHAGAHVELVRFPKVVHGFCQLSAISDTCAEASGELYHRLRVAAHRLTLT